VLLQPRPSPPLRSPPHAASCVEERELGLRVDGFRAAGRAAIQASTSSSFHARAFGVIRTPGGKSWESIGRLSVMRLLTTPLATRSGYLIHFIVLTSRVPSTIGVSRWAYGGATRSRKSPNNRIC